MDEACQRQLGIGEHAGEALRVFGPQIAVQHGATHVRIHQQHPLAQLSQGLGKKSRGGAFSLPLGGRGDRHQPHGLVGPQQPEVGEEVAQRFLDGKPLTPPKRSHRLADCEPLPAGQVGHHPEQGRGEPIAEFLGVMEHVIDPIPQQGQAHPCHGSEQSRVEQTPRHAGLHGPAPKLRWHHHLPGHRALGHLQAKALPRFDVRGEIVAGHPQLLLQGFILLHLARIALKLPAELLLLAPDFGQLQAIFAEAGEDGIKLLALQKWAQPGTLGLQLPNLGRIVGEGGFGFRQLPLHLEQIDRQGAGRSSSSPSLSRPLLGAVWPNTALGQSAGGLHGRHLELPPPHGRSLPLQAGLLLLQLLALVAKAG